jgi:hypothetical protein
MTTYTRLSIALALPRSGTYWSTRLVRPGVFDAWHDPLGPLRGDVDALRAQVDQALASNEGRLYLADTGGVLWHHQLRKAFPRARLAFILRDPGQVEASLRAAGAPLPAHQVKVMHRALLDAIGSCDNPVLIRYRRPFDLDGARRLWRMATGTLPGATWLESMRAQSLARPLAEQLASLA